MSVDHLVTRSQNDKNANEESAMIYKTMALAMLLCAAAVESREVPVGDFFKDPEFTEVTLSPNGKYLAVTVPQGDRTLLAVLTAADTKLVGKWDYGTNKHISNVLWVNNERFFMYVTEKTGRFDQRQGLADVFATNVDGTKRADIPNGGFYGLVDTLKDDDESILVQRSINSGYLFKLNVYDGKTRTVATAPLDSASFIVDHDHKVRYAIGQMNDLTFRTLRRNGDDWDTVHESEMGGGSRIPMGFDRDNKNVYMTISDKGEPSRTVLMDPETGKVTPFSKNENVEPDDNLMSADGKELLAIRYMDGVPHYDFVNKTHPESKAYAGLINAFPDHVVGFRGISEDGRFILFRAASDIDPGSYYMFDRETGKARFLLSNMSWIKPADMANMEPIQVTARDGVKLHGYLTLPKDGDGKNLPLILHPHGGPHGPRDQWGFNPEVQFLANRGYAVLQINFRGSGGYGNAFEKMGYRNWGTTMINDMTDAVDWVIKQGIADSSRVCTYGASYGGYAALQTVVREPTKYVCTIGYVGVYSLPMMFTDGDIPEQESGRKFLKRVMPETREEQEAQSAAYNVDKINIPVMLVQGAKDRRVPIAQYKALLNALTKAGKAPEKTIVAPKEGHGFYDFKNQVNLYTAMEAFLDKHTRTP
jgi:dipeptidyl aminopeptidase/acylaminoacyl peptidase